MAELTSLNGHNHALADAAPEKENASERIFLAVTPALLASLENYRFAKRHKSQSSAMRKLLEVALEHEGFLGKKTPHA